MTSDSQYPNQKKVFTQYWKHLVFILIFVGLVGVFAGEEKESASPLCTFTNEGCKQDLVAEIMSRAIRFFGFGISAALVTAVVLALRLRVDFKERVIKAKKVLLDRFASVKSKSRSANVSLLNRFRKQDDKGSETLQPLRFASAKSKSKSVSVSLLGRFRKQGDKGSGTLQRQANQYATVTSALAGFLFVLVIIGSVIIAFSPEERCGSGYFIYDCEKDWFSSILMALGGFFLSSLTLFSVLTVATYIQWRTSRPETDSN